MSQLDLICTTCPMERCDESSLWCLYRFLTNPNEAQKALITKPERLFIKLRRNVKRERERIRKRKRAQHDARYYAANKDKKLKAANERNARLRQERV